MMIELALKAMIPVVSVRTDDLLNLDLMLKDIANGRTVSNAPDYWEKSSKGDIVLYHGWDDRMDRDKYRRIVQKEISYLLINPPEGSHNPFVFDAGWLYPSKDLLNRFLSKLPPKLNAPGLAEAASGLTIQRMVDLIRLTQAAYGELSVVHFRTLRHQMSGMTKGVSDVAIDLTAYVKNEQLSKWVELNKRFFISPPDPRLIPKGLLLSGEPGVGKTMGAKFLAHELGCPLYRVDMASTLNKYIGESESNFGAVLSVIDKEEPCVLLLDEVEKVFTKDGSDSGTSSRIMSQLLWWLQEHTSRVLTVMTCNDQDKLPKEMYRVGRIDKVITMLPMNATQANEFGLAIYKTFDKQFEEPYTEKMLYDDIWGFLKAKQGKSFSPYYLTQAEVVGIVHDFVKRTLYKPGESNGT